MNAIWNRKGAPWDEISARSLWVVLGVIVAVGMVTRFLYLGDIYLWIDETPFLDGLLYDYGSGVRGFLRGLRSQASYHYFHGSGNGMWAVIVYTVCKAFGSSDLWWARLPGAIAGFLLVPMMFIFTREVSDSRLAGLVAAGAATMSIVQIHYSQQLLEYGFSVLAGVFVIWSTVAWYESLRPQSPPVRYIPSGFLFFVSVTVAAIHHKCLFPLILVCFSYLLCSILWLWSRGNLKRDEAIYNLAAVLQTGVVIVGSFLVFILPRLHAGFKDYLAPYYAPPEWLESGGMLSIAVAMIRFGLWRCYDLLTYCLNTVYNVWWYQPLGLNALVIAPSILVLIGIVSLWLRTRKGKVVVVLALASVILIFIGAVARRYPFGGVRQCLPLAVFIYIFLGVGISKVYQRSKVLAMSAVAFSIVVWLYALPQFYSERLSPYNTESLLRYIRLSGNQLLITTNYWGNPEDAVFRYHLRHHPEVIVFPLSKMLDDLKRNRRPFLLASTTKSLQKLRSLSQPEENSIEIERIALNNLLSDRRVRIAILAEVALNPAPAKMQDECCSQSIYTPLNGLFLYKITWNCP